MSFWANKQVLMTGGTGYIGSHLVEILLGQYAFLGFLLDFRLCVWR